VAPSALCKFHAASSTIHVEPSGTSTALRRCGAHELAAARQRLVLLGRKTATERLASFLLMLAGRATPVRGGDEIGFPMSRADIADYLGLRIETVSREISALKASRVIQLTGRQSFRIVDRDRLEQLAEG
jgi:CRP/FNR family transcriptional regulator